MTDREKPKPIEIEIDRELAGKTFRWSDLTSSVAANTAIATTYSFETRGLITKSSAEITARALTVLAGYRRQTRDTIEKLIEQTNKVPSGFNLEGVELPILVSVIHGMNREDERQQGRSEFRQSIWIPLIGGAIIGNIDRLIAAVTSLLQ
jgi:hypothetical protein